MGAKLPEVDGWCLNYFVNLQHWVAKREYPDCNNNNGHHLCKPCCFLLKSALKRRELPVLDGWWSHKRPSLWQSCGIFPQHLAPAGAAPWLSWVIREEISDLRKIWGKKPSVLWPLAAGRVVLSHLGPLEGKFPALTGSGRLRMLVLSPVLKWGRILSWV